MRGEYFFNLGHWHDLVELPPRARRILSTRCAPRDTGGTTSACAENTLTTRVTTLEERNYLRVRGEYAFGKPSTCFFRELPPRARRIQPGLTTPMVPMGTTSACAENTHHQPGNDKHNRNYLRVRGEYMQQNLRLHPLRELPPRARRIRRRRA